MCYQWKGVHHREVGYAQSVEQLASGGGGFDSCGGPILGVLNH